MAKPGPGEGKGKELCGPESQESEFPLAQDPTLGKGGMGGNLVIAGIFQFYGPLDGRTRGGGHEVVRYMGASLV